MMFHVKQSTDSYEPTGDALCADDVLRGLLDVGVAASAKQANLLARHAQLVAEANRSFNLTRVTSSEEVLRLHIGDSATALPFVEAAPSGTVLDLGSGAGYPGVVLSVLSDRNLVLVESVTKKANFLRSVASELSLNAVVLDIRAEELALESPAAYSCVVARAVSALPSLIELASPLLAVGGRLVCMKAKPSQEELDSGAFAAGRCGMRLLENSQFELPGGESRSIVVYERRGKAHEKLPRRSGMAQRHPLGRASE
jgi:16S rRNA (guanine527-N7)-methyltransferase